MPCPLLSFRVKTVKYQSMPALAFLVLMEERATFILATKTTSGTTVFVIMCYAMWKFCQWYQLLVSKLRLVSGVCWLTLYGTACKDGT